MDTQSPPRDVANMNLFGCAEELDRLLTQIHAITHTLDCAAREIDAKDLQGTCWCITDMVERCLQVRRRAWKLMPKTN